MESGAITWPCKPPQPNRGVKVLEATDFYYPWIAGPAPLIRNLSSGLIEHGHDVVIAGPSPIGQPYDEHDPSAIHRVRTWPVPFGYRLRAGAPFVDLNRMVMRWRPDIIHIHHPFPISLAALYAGCLHGVPVVATNHTIPECTLFGLKNSRLYSPVRKAFSIHINTVLRSASAVATPTRTAAALLRDNGFTKHVQCISNGVDTQRFHPRTNDFLDGVPVVLYTGRLDDDKGIETLIRAVPIVLARVQARFRIGGEGTDRERLERLVIDMGLTQVVEFSGYVPEEELPDVYRSASLFAISSTVELQSISTLEAMASGLPIVAANAGALPEIVRPGVNGVLVEPGNANAFGEAIVVIIQNEIERRTMGLQSRMIGEEHSLGQMTSQYESLFRNLMHERTAGAVHGAARL